MDRPRRSTRQPVKAPQLLKPEPPRVIKRKPAAEIDPEKMFKILLESSKSDIVSLDMNDIINSNTWTVLSEDSKARLKALMPPTAFVNYHETLGSDHPSIKNTMSLDESKKDSQDVELTSTAFNDPHFLAAARTFQDHLYSNWFSEAHVQKVKQYQAGIVDGTLAAPWKDQTWEHDNPVPEPPPKDIAPSSSFSTPNALAGGASQIKLHILAKNNIIRVGDIIAFRRVFITSDIVVEKDCIVESIHPKTFAITLLAPRGTTKDLPPNLLSNEELSDTSDSPGLVLSMTITSLSMLETAILDTDSRVDKLRRPNGNAWKTFSVWRFRGGGEYNPYDSRGGRENHGTLFYLRGSFYHESWRN